MIRFEGVQLHLGSFVLGPLDLGVARGEHVLLVGPSGAGKSLVLELIAGFRTPEVGRIALRGSDAHGIPAHQRRCGWVPQAHTLFPHLSVQRNIEYGLRALSIEPAARAQRVAHVAERLGIAHLLDRRPPTLSGGERQRVALARALVTEFDVLLLDEPFSSLEPGRRRQLWRLVRELHRELGLTIVHVTHDLEEAAAFEGTAVVMVEGRIIQSGPLAQVLREPADPRVVEALGE